MCRRGTFGLDRFGQTFGNTLIRVETRTPCSCYAARESPGVSRPWERATSALRVGLPVAPSAWASQLGLPIGPSNRGAPDRETRPPAAANAAIGSNSHTRRARAHNTHRARRDAPNSEDCSGPNERIPRTAWIFADDRMGSATKTLDEGRSECLSGPTQRRNGRGCPSTAKHIPDRSKVNAQVRIPPVFCLQFNSALVPCPDFGPMRRLRDHASASRQCLSFATTNKRPD